MQLFGTDGAGGRGWAWVAVNGAALVRVHGTKKALAITTDCTPRYCKADPLEGGRQAVAEAWRNITATGARPLAITDCLNFGNPEKPDIMGQFVGCIEGMRDACETLDFPVVSGNVSLYNETQGAAVLPTPAIGGVGLIGDYATAAAPAFRAEAETIVLIGETALNLTAMFNHANVRMPVGLDRVLRWIVVTPDMHRVHHSVGRDEHSRNFGFNFPWWDRLLGTYRDQPASGHEAMTIGLDEYQAHPRQGLSWMIALPFRKADSGKTTAA